MMVSIAVSLKFHVLGNVELEFAFMIDFLKRMVLEYYLGEKLSFEIPRQSNENTIARYCSVYSSICM